MDWALALPICLAEQALAVRRGDMGGTERASHGVEGVHPETGQLSWGEQSEA